MTAYRPWGAPQGPVNPCRGQALVALVGLGLSKLTEPYEPHRLCGALWLHVLLVLRAQAFGYSQGLGAPSWPIRGPTCKKYIF